MLQQLGVRGIDICTHKITQRGRTRARSSNSLPHDTLESSDAKREF